MMTTRRPDGHLVSRAMANQKRAPGADLWFVTSKETHKVEELEDEPLREPLVLQGPHARVGVGVGGREDLAGPRDHPQALGRGLEGVVRQGTATRRHGTADDPRIVLIGVDVQSAVFFEMDKPQPVVLFELVKGWVTGKEPDLGKMHQVRGNAD